MPFFRPPLPPVPPVLLLLALLALVPRGARAEPGDLITTHPLPPGVGQAAGVAFDGAGLWVSELMAAGEPESEYKLMHFDADGSLDQVVPGGPGQVLQKLAWDGHSLWATRMYDELVRLDADGNEVTAYDIPFAQGLAADRATGRLFVLEGQGSTSLHVVEQGSVTATIDTEQDHLYWWGLAWDGCSLWTVDKDDDDELVRLDADSGAELERRPAPTTRLTALAFNGHALVATDTATDLVVEIEIGVLTKPDGSVCVPELGEVAPVVEDPPSSDPSEPEPAPSEDDPANGPPDDQADEPSPSDPSPDDENEDIQDPAVPTDEEPVEEGTTDEGSEVEEGYFDSPDSPFERRGTVQVRGGCACVQPEKTFGGGVAAFVLLGGLLLRRRRSSRGRRRPGSCCV